MLTDPHEDYTRGWVPFLGTTIYIDSRPLIPRVETEYWTELVIAEMLANTRPPERLGRAGVFAIRVLDLFAGSGCVGVAVLKHVPNAIVDFGELESRHFGTIEKSVRENGIDPKRTRMIQTDVWSNITDRYDVILANPPYLDTSDQTLGLAHEPGEALYAGEGGMELVKKTIEGAGVHLKPGGSIWIEHGDTQAAQVATICRHAGLSSSIIPDQYGVDRVTRATVA